MSVAKNTAHRPSRDRDRHVRCPLRRHRAARHGRVVRRNVSHGRTLSRGNGRGWSGQRQGPRSEPAPTVMLALGSRVEPRTRPAAKVAVLVRWPPVTPLAAVPPRATAARAAAHARRTRVPPGSPDSPAGAPSRPSSQPLPPTRAGHRQPLHTLGRLIRRDRLPPLPPQTRPIVRLEQPALVAPVAPAGISVIRRPTGEAQATLRQAVSSAAQAP